MRVFVYGPIKVWNFIVYFSMGNDVSSGLLFYLRCTHRLHVLFIFCFLCRMFLDHLRPSTTKITNAALTAEQRYMLALSHLHARRIVVLREAESALFEGLTVPPMSYTAFISAPKGIKGMFAIFVISLTSCGMLRMFSHF